MTDDPTKPKPKITMRFNEDPFGVGVFRKQVGFPESWVQPLQPPKEPTLAPGLMLPGVPKPASAPPTVVAAAPPHHAQPPSAPGGAPALPAWPETKPPQPPAMVLEEPPPAAPLSTAELIAGEMKLQFLRNMFPQHNITPVDYDPFKALPKGLGEKVNVNEGVV